MSHNPHHHKKLKKLARRVASSVACCFCGSPYNYCMRIGDWDEIDVRYHITCAVCGATSPTAATRPEALTAWESRSKPIPLGETEPPADFCDTAAELADV